MQYICEYRAHGSIPLTTMRHSISTFCKIAILLAFPILYQPVRVYMHPKWCWNCTHTNIVASVKRVKFVARRRIIIGVLCYPSRNLRAKSTQLKSHRKCTHSHSSGAHTHTMELIRPGIRGEYANDDSTERENEREKGRADGAHI